MENHLIRHLSALFLVNKTPRRNGGSTKKKKNIFAYIWFDVEDYMTPEANDTPLQAARILQKYKIPATYKLVAEKVRFLKEKKRQDVISAIKEYCDVGYHTDTHSRHPVVYEYISKMDVLQGAKEIERREKSGVQEVARTFGRTPACFGHAGTQFAPHYYPFLKNAGIDVYLDATDIVNIDDSPYWYCGVLCLNNTDRNYIRFDRTFEDPNGNQRILNRFKEIHARLQKNGGGAISVLWHPHTAINKEYWDALNFVNGKNTPKGRYVLPEEQPPEIKKRALEDFENLLRFMSSFDDVQFITATTARKVYPRKLELVLGIKEVRQIARHLSRSNGRFSYFKLGDEYISPAQAFSALTNFIASYSKAKNRLPKRTLMNEPLGPMAPFRRSTARTKNLPLADLLAASEKASRFMAEKGCMPSSVRIGNSAELAPSDFLATLSKLALELIRGKKPIEIPLQRAKLILEEKFVDSQAFKRACQWKILPKGFSAPKILEQAKLQTWTLVPAVPRIKLK